MPVASKLVDDEGPADPVECLLWKFKQAQTRAKMYGYEMPRCAGDILVLLCHRDDATRQEAEENFTNTLKTIQRLNASDVAHLPPSSEVATSYINFNEAIDYPENLITKVSGRKGVILRLSPHGKYKLVQDAEAVRNDTLVQISPQQVKDLYLAIRAAALREFVHPNTTSPICIGKYGAYDSLPFWKVFPTCYQHQMIRDSKTNTFPICWNKCDCDVRSLVIGHISLLAGGDRYSCYDPRKAVERMAIARAFTPLKMSVAYMWYNLSSLQDMDFYRRHDKIWEKAMERVDKNSRYSDLLDISKFKNLPITIPASPPVYQAKIKRDE